MLSIDDFAKYAAVLKNIKTPKLPHCIKLGNEPIRETLDIGGFKIQLLTSPHLPKDTVVLVTGPLKEMVDALRRNDERGVHENGFRVP